MEITHDFGASGPQCECGEAGTYRLKREGEMWHGVHISCGATDLHLSDSPRLRLELYPPGTTERLIAQAQLQREERAKPKPIKRLSALEIELSSVLGIAEHLRGKIARGDV